MSDSLHGGHRARLRQQYLSHGLDSLHEVNVLELLLFYAIPRQDTNPIAHRLLAEFGSLSGVLDAPMEELTGRGKLSENAAALLKLVPDVARRQQLSRRERRGLDTISGCAEYLAPCFYSSTVERVYLLALDGSCRPLGCREMGKGTVSGASLEVRALAEYALSVGAVSVVLAHNHLSGSAAPSQEDLDATAAIRAALQPLGITLADHLIFCDGDYVSMAENALL